MFRREWRSRIDELAALGPEWAALVPRWDELEAAMRSEFGQRTAPKAWRVMRSLLGKVEHSNGGDE